VQISASKKGKDTLLYMANQSMHSDSKAIVSCKWLANLDLKFVVMSAAGDLNVYEVILNREEELQDSIQVTRIHQVQTFEELPQQF